MKVENLRSTSGAKIANQFKITEGNKRWFRSYNAVICVIEDGKTTLDEKYWNYSKTTGKYRNLFLGESIVETRKKIQSGEYKLANLN